MDTGIPKKETPDRSLAAFRQSLVTPATRKVRLLQGAALLLVLLILYSKVQQYRAAAMERSDREICFGHLKEISAAFMAYRRDHNGRLPRALVPSPAPAYIGEADTLYPRYIKSRDVLVCPTWVKFQAGRGNIHRPGEPTYQYLVGPWVRDLPFDKDFRSDEFYNQIVPERGNRIILLTCDSHPGNLNVWSIMWDGSIKEQPFLYDASFGRSDRMPETRRIKEEIRRKGGILPEDQPGSRP